MFVGATADASACPVSVNIPPVLVEATIAARIFASAVVVKLLLLKSNVDPLFIDPVIFGAFTSNGLPVAVVEVKLALPDKVSAFNCAKLFAIKANNAALFVIFAVLRAASAERFSDAKLVSLSINVSIDVAEGSPLMAAKFGAPVAENALRALVPVIFTDANDG